MNYEPQLLYHVGNEHSNLLRFGETIFFNTWYAQQQFKYMNRYGITFDTLYSAFDDSCKSLWNFSLSDISDNPSDFFPIIDYSKFEIGTTSEWSKNYTGKKVLVENGLAQSDQAHNFPMTPIIIKMAQKHPDITFILTATDGIALPSNVFYSDNIIKKNIRSDLNEISYLSSHCDMIVGRSSGAFTFTLTQQNLFQRNIKIISFSNLVPNKNNKYWLGDLLQDKINYSSTILVSNENNVDIVQCMIEENLP